MRHAVQYPYYIRIAYMAVVIFQPHLSERAYHRRAPQKVFVLAPQVIDSRVRGRIIAHPGAPGLLFLAQSVMFGYLRLLT